MEWRPIPSFPSYIVSEYGDVMRTGGRLRPTGKPLKPWLRKDGYRSYGLRRDGKKIDTNAHQVVAEAFLGPAPFSGAMVRHIDGTTANGDHYTKLRWGTRAENEADKLLVGTDNRGERHGMSKLTSEQVAAIVARYQRGDISQREIAADYGVHQMTVSLVVRGKLWGHTTGLEAVSFPST